MPVYGRTRFHPRRIRVRRRANTIAQIKVEKGRARTHYERDTTGFGVQNSSLSLVSRILGFPIAKWVAACHAVTNHPVSVVDWGCGTGVAISRLGRRFPKFVKAIGFDRKAYHAWNTGSGARFIHRDYTQLHRFLKDGSIDLIYSNHALYHLFTENQMRTTAARADYVSMLAKKLRPSGVLVTNLVWMSSENITALQGALERMLPDYVISTRPLTNEKDGRLLIRRKPIKQYPIEIQGRLPFPKK